MSSRAHGQGSITRRQDGRWEARLRVRRQGRRTVRSAYGRTKKEAGEKLDRMRREELHGLDAEKLTVDELAERYLEATRLPTLRLQTWRRNERCLRCHVRPELGHWRLRDLDTPAGVSAIDRLYARLREKGLAPNTLVRIHATLHAMLGYAVTSEALVRNPSDRLAYPPRWQPTQAQALGRDQVRALLAALQGRSHAALWLLALCHGLRVGELRALRWTHVLLEQGTLQVVASMDAESLEVGETKSHRSRRPIVLSQAVLEALQLERQAQLERRLRWGIRPPAPERDFVFTGPTGEPLTRSALQSAWRTLCGRAGLEHVRIHDLRHTAATALMGKVPARAVQEMLGHSKIGITLDTYSHVSSDLQQATAEAVDVAIRELLPRGA